MEASAKGRLESYPICIFTVFPESFAQTLPQSVCVSLDVYLLVSPRPATSRAQPRVMQTLQSHSWAEYVYALNRRIVPESKHYSVGWVILFIHFEYILGFIAKEHEIS